MRPANIEPTARAFSPAGRDQHDRPRIEHRADAHRQRLSRNPIEPPAEERCIRAAGFERESRSVLRALQRRAGLVEPDVGVAADAEQQQVQPSERRDLPLEPLALCVVIARCRRSESARGRPAG